MPDQLPNINALSGIRPSLVAFLNEKAELGEEAFGTSSLRRPHLAALQLLANDVQARDEIRDRYLVILGDVNARLAQIRRMRGLPGNTEARVFAPSRWQGQVVATLADSGAMPDTETTLLELCAAGVRDLAEEYRKSESDLNQTKAGLDAETEQLRAQLGELRSRNAELEEDAAAADGIREELERANRVIAELREFADNQVDSPAGTNESGGENAPDLEAIYDGVEKRLGRDLAETEIAEIGGVLATVDAGEAELIDMLAGKFGAESVGTSNTSKGGDPSCSRQPPLRK